MGKQPSTSLICDHSTLFFDEFSAELIREIKWIMITSA